jgi:hypothetical protein
MTAIINKLYEAKTFDNQIIAEILAAPLIIPVSGK